MAVFRAYDNGQPVHCQHYLKWNVAGAKDQDLVFVTGNPQPTQRNGTFSTYQLLIHTTYPGILEKLHQMLDTDETYSKSGPEQARQAGSEIFGLQNTIKALDGTVKAASNPDLIVKKRTDEQEFQTKIGRNPEWKQKFGDAWTSLDEANQRFISHAKSQIAYRLVSDLDEIARNIVEYAGEVHKPAGERLPGFQDAELTALQYKIMSPAPLYPEFEKARLAASLNFALNKLVSCPRTK